jgi:hypothetical protein
VRKIPLVAGTKFGRLTVIEPTANLRKRTAYVCRCDCGVQIAATADALKTGNTTSCGCFSRECTGNRFAKHRLRSSPEYKTWQSVIQRCCNPRNPSFPRYGGRGIAMCQRWRESFESFFADMGHRPAGTSIDRINNNGNYEPANCRWATDLEQRRNTSLVKLNPARAADIRERAGAGEPIASIAASYGITRTHTRDVVAGKCWA